MQIKIYTTQWCSDCRVTKMYLDQMQISYQEIDIENDERAAEYVMSVNGGKRSVPTVEYGGDAVSLSNFSRGKLEEFLVRHDLQRKLA